MYQDSVLLAGEDSAEDHDRLLDPVAAQVNPLADHGDAELVVAPDVKTMTL